jgi:hypothetical protein
LRADELWLSGSFGQIVPRRRQFKAEKWRKKRDFSDI